MLAGLAGFTSRHQSGHVRSVVAHSLPARFEILIVRARVTSLHDCIVSMQALAFAGSFHFAKSGPPSLSRCSITGSRTRVQQVEWCICTVHVLVHVYTSTSRSDRLLFRLAALRPSEGPQRSALVAFSFHKAPPNFRRRRTPYKMNVSWKARQSVRPAGNLARNFVNTSHCHENVPNFSKLPDDRPWSWNRRLQWKLSRCLFCLVHN